MYIYIHSMFTNQQTSPGGAPAPLWLFPSHHEAPGPAPLVSVSPPSDELISLEVWGGQPTITSPK